MRSSAANRELEEIQEWDLHLALRDYVKGLFESQDSEQYTFHNFRFVEDFVTSVQMLSQAENQDPAEQEVLVIASFFSFSGYSQGHPAIFEKSKKNADDFLSGNNTRFEESQLFSIKSKIFEYIDILSHTSPPRNLSESILKDAACIHLAKKKFIKRSNLLREELESIGHETFSDEEWASYLAGLLGSVKFYTQTARSEYGEKLQDNLRAFHKIWEKVAESEKANSRPRGSDKGVDTFFRTQSRYLSNLVGLADRKAQMIIGVCSISMSILISGMGDLLAEHSPFIICIGLFIVSNVAAMIGAVFVIMPQVPKARSVDQEDILRRHGSLIAHVMFSEIELETFRLGIKQLMSNDAYAYDTLIDNMYGTGRVLKKKFKYLRFSYLVFVYGFSTALLSLPIVYAVFRGAHKLW